MIICFYFILIIGLKCVIVKETAQTLSLRERVDLLKFKISEDLKAKQKGFTTTASTNDDDEYEYVDDNAFPITPINEFDVRKKHGRYRFKEIKTKPTTTDDSPMLHKDLRTGKKLDKFSVKKPIEIFYRRYMDEKERNTPQQYMHCQELVTPIINGMKTNASVPKVLLADDSTVLRFIQLINLNTTDYTKEEILSVLYQISNLKLRLFHWDVNAMILLLNTLSYEKKHTFRTVKNGLKHLFFKKWALDLSNATNLVLQTRIFRPPCIRSPSDTGSTMSTRTQRFKKAKGTPKCKSLDFRTECQPHAGE